MNIFNKSFVILTIALLLLTLFSVSLDTTVATNLNILNINIDNKNSDFDRYIIQFNEEPLLRFKTRFTEKIKNFLSHLSENVKNAYLNRNVQKYKEKLISLHKNAKEDILGIIGRDLPLKEIFSADFINVFNGLSIKRVSLEILDRIQKLPYVKKIFPNYKISVKLDESIPLINADDVWNIEDAYGNCITGEGVTIAILDTGVDYNHPDLKDNYIAEGSYDFVNDDMYPMDDFGHGTHCAGIACGKGIESSFQYVGVAPDAKFYAFKILDESGNGDWQSYTLGMEAAVNLGVDIVSLSFGTETPGDPNDPLCQVANILVDAGVVVVAAAGNLGDEPRTITSPGCAINAICVGSIDKNKEIATSSSRGPVELNGQDIVKPDVVAPGVRICSTAKGGGYITMSGTSMATPHLAGATALILQANPNFNPNEVKSVLKETSFDLGYEANTQGNGMIDALKAIGSDVVLNIDTPNEIYELQRFTVNITNNYGNPVKTWILFTVPFHLPRLKYGASVSFISPIILRPLKNTLEGKIRVFEQISLIDILKNNYDYKKVIIILNRN